MEDFEYIKHLDGKQIVVPAEDEYLSGIIKSTLEELEVDESDNKVIANISVIVEEAYVNVSHYSGSKNAYVSIYKDCDCGFFLLEDEGTKFDPLEVNNNAYTSGDVDRRMGGLGILLIKKMSQGVIYEYSDNKNRLLIKLKRR